MTVERLISFSPFTLNISRGSLLLGAKPIPLRPKTFAVLQYLAENPDRLVAKEELIRAVWPTTRVVEGGLKVSIGEIRRALGDNNSRPRFIETVGKKGYRFIAPLSLRLPEYGKESFLPFVGRAAELNQLRHHLEIANSGKRQTVFVTGEPGIGKTTLVEAFLRSLPPTDDVIAAHGQCIEQFGAGEAYMPVLDALERLCNGPNGPECLKLLHRYAPSWLANLPNIIDPAERSLLQQQTVGLTPERRLREIAAFLEALAKEQTLLLVLEDLHWLDPSTLAMISFLAQRRETARLLLIGTYRPSDVESQKHPLKQEKENLELHHQCSQLPLSLLSRSVVGEYLAARFETPLVSNKITSTIYKHSEGNPLFMVNMTDYLIASESITQQKGLVELDPKIERQTTPATIRQLIEQQFERLSSEDQELLEIASVRGMIFSAATVAAVLGKPIEAVENRCTRLVKGEHFLQSSDVGKWPDGTVSSSYSFIHSLYQNVIYDRIGSSRRARLHQTIGIRLQTGYQGQTESIAAELALHFQRGGDGAAAVRYFLQAAEQAMRQSACSEAISHARSGLQLLSSASEMSDRTEIELQLRLLLSLSLTAVSGYASAEAAQAFRETRAVCRKVGKQIALIRTLSGLWAFHLMRGDLSSAFELANEMLNDAYALRDPLALAEGHMSAGVSYFYLGDFVAAQTHFDKSLDSQDPDAPKARALLYGWDTRVVSLTYGAANLWLLGYPTKDLHCNRRGSAMAQAAPANPLNVVIANGMLAGHYQFRGEPVEAHRCAEIALTAAEEFGFTHWIASASISSGWGLAAKGDTREGIGRIARGLELWKATGARAELPRFNALLAEVYLLAGDVQAGLQSLKDAQAAMQETDERFYEAEIYRLKGELLLKSNNVATRRMKKHEAEHCFLQAVEISRRQKSKSLELRATMSLCRLWQREGKEKEARKTLKRAYGWFTEGFDSPDLRNANTLLEQLSGIVNRRPVKVL